MAELTMSAETIDRLNQVARQRGNTPQSLAEQFIRQFLHEEAERKMQQEADAFRSMHSDLLAAYPDQYVALYGSTQN